MAGHAYATASDVYRECGMGALAFVTRPRPIDPRAGDSLDHATGTFTLIGHGYEPDDQVRMVLVASGGSLPGGATSAPLYPVPVDFYRFRLSATQGGAALTFTSAGSGFGLQASPEPRLLRLSRSCSAIVDQCLVALVPPIERDADGNYPEVIVGVVARMVARRFLPTMMSENPSARATFDRLADSAAFDGDTSPPAQKGSLLGDWKSGQPVSPTPIDQTSGPDDAAWATSRTPADFIARVM